jgi:CRISPR-associated protein Csm3
MSGPFLAKLRLSGTLRVVTGLHVGGAKSSLEIGGVDKNVIKTAAGVPFIPGSSLKGKLRSLLAREDGKDDVREDTLLLKTIFGEAATGKDRSGRDTGIVARLICRDAFLDLRHFRWLQGEEAIAEVAEPNEHQKLTALDLPYTEVKWENRIERKTGTAKDPRQIERVPAGARFRFQMLYTALAGDDHALHLRTVQKALRLLQDDYLGGSGTRGSGQVTFGRVRLRAKTLTDYEGANEWNAHSLSDDFLQMEESFESVTTLLAGAHRDATGRGAAESVRDANGPSDESGSNPTA